jgi:Cupin-like domain
MYYRFGEVKCHPNQCFDFPDPTRMAKKGRRRQREHGAAWFVGLGVQFAVQQFCELSMSTTASSSSSSSGNADSTFVQVNVAAPLRVSTAADHDPTTGGSVVDRISFSPHDGSHVISMDLKTLCSKLLLSSSPEEEKDHNSSYYYYMTTQTLPVDDEGRPAVCSWLPQVLIDRQIVPLRPKILGHLIPMSSAGLWLGRTPTNHHQHQHNDDDAMTTKKHVRSSSSSSNSTSSTSGLHHDHHDNLYCLIHGRKTFRIAPPGTVQTVTTAGTLYHLHTNGRIVYTEDLPNNHPSSSSSYRHRHRSNNNSHKLHESSSSECARGVNDSTGGCPIRPDGALASVERIMELEQRREVIAALLDEIDDDDDQDDDDDASRSRTTKTKKQQQKKALEAELDAIEEELLDHEMNGNDGEVDDDGTSGDDDISDDNDDGEEDNDDDGTGKGAKNVTVGLEPNRKKVKRNNSSVDDDEADDVQQSSSKNQKNAELHDGDDDDEDEKERLPLNFVLGDTSNVKFETIELYAGDALYLPAGWFHEVTSHGGLHLAVNYWVHPPDVVVNVAADDTAKGVCFERPYQSQFWQRDWDARGRQQI